MIWYMIDRRARETVYHTQATAPLYETLSHYHIPVYPSLALWYIQEAQSERDRRARETVYLTKLPLLCTKLSCSRSMIYLHIHLSLYDISMSFRAKETVKREWPYSGRDNVPHRKLRLLCTQTHRGYGSLFLSRSVCRTLVCSRSCLLVFGDCKKGGVCVLMCCTNSWCVAPTVGVFCEVLGWM